MLIFHQILSFYSYVPLINGSIEVTSSLSLKFLFRKSLRYLIGSKATFFSGVFKFFQYLYTTLSPESLCFYTIRINYRPILFHLDQASALLKFEFLEGALNFPLMTDRKKE